VASGNLPQWVADEAIHYLEERLNGHGGIILVDSSGRFGIAHNTPGMAWAVQSPEITQSGMHRE
jgi:beta-aspartyl-peptidase (threonine type)